MIERPPEYGHRLYPPFPRIGVGVLVFRDDHILLIERGNEPGLGKWTVPGGLVELGESLEDSVHREISEECGIRICGLQQVDIFQFIELDDDDVVKYHYVVIDYLADYLAGRLRARSDVERAGWFKADEVANLGTTEATRQLLEKALRFR
jgi:ADP-ribose pyrophosphatase YjhB (NUDIX family)